jgi:hypothetical protein
VQAFIDQSTYSFPVLQQAGALQTSYSIIYDNYVVVDADGIVRYTSQNRPRHPSTGRFYDAELRAAIQEWLPPPTSASETAPAAFYLRVQNPHGASVGVEFGLPVPTAVDLAVFDVTGRNVRTLAAGPFKSGPHTVFWDRADRSGRITAAGAYFVRLRAGTLARTRKVVVLD